jgi:hypothetical protein
VDDSGPQRIGTVMQSSAISQRHRALSNLVNDRSGEIWLRCTIAEFENLEPGDKTVRGRKAASKTPAGTCSA